MSPSWDSLSELQAYQSLLNSILVWGGLACVVIAATVGTFVETAHEQT
jgi:hypothetical protein